jgi:ParB family transcriptional regulator, chromosome partitioning protein
MSKKAAIKAETEMPAEMMHIPLFLIEADPENPRVVRDSEEDKEFFANVKEIGVQEPILVRPIGKGTYRIVFGERRWSAQTASGRETIPCIVRDLTDKEAQELAVVENLCRANINPADEVLSVARLAKYGDSIPVIAKKLGKPSGWVARRANIALMGDKVLDLIRRKLITIAHAEEIGKISSNESLMMEMVKSCESGSIRLADLRTSIERRLRDLSNAIFDKSKKYGNCGPCSKCKLRSDKQGELFEDQAGRSLCLDAKCWDTRMEAYLAEKRAEIEAQGKKIVEESSYWTTSGIGGYLVEGKDDAEIQKFKEAGIQPRVLIDDETGEVTEHFNKNDAPGNDEDEQEDEEDSEEVKQNEIKREFNLLVADAIDKCAPEAKLTDLITHLLEAIQSVDYGGIINRSLEDNESARTVADLDLNFSESMILLLQFVNESISNDETLFRRFLESMNIDHDKLMKKAVKKVEQNAN